MRSSILKCAFLTALIFAGSVAASAQCPVMPAGFLCISQTAGNVAKQDRLEVIASREEITALKGAIVDLKQQIANTAATAAKNEADLKAENTKLLVQIADKSGALGECRADKLMYAPLIEYLTKNQRAKKIGIINL